MAALGLALLLLAGATDGRSTSFSLDVPNVVDAAILNPGQEACERPVVTTSSFGGLRAWAQAGIATGAALGVSVRDAEDERVIARGRLAVTSVTPGAYTATLSSTVPSGRRVAVCLRSEGPSRVALLGSTPVTGSVGLTAAGKREPLELSLVFERAKPRSLLSLVPTIFDRAALFRPSWVGAWTFWVLAFALLAAVVLGGAAVSRAARADGLGQDDPSGD